MSEVSGSPEPESATAGPESTEPLAAELLPPTEPQPRTQLPTEPQPRTQLPIEPPQPMEPPPPAVETTRHLLGASFDLLSRTSNEMRRASFYIGFIVLGTVGPLALASWALEVLSLHMNALQLGSVLESGAAIWLGWLGVLAAAGLVVAATESRAMASSILGGHLAGRPISVRSSLARSRMVFWRVIVGSLVAAIPVLVVQALLNAGFEAALGRQTDISVVSSTLAAALAGAPFAYVLGGIALGDVEPFESTRRSIRVFRARKLAAALVAVFETIATLLVILGLGAGLDVALRVFGAVGLGSGSGPAGLTLMTIGVLAGVFALGTLIYTAYAIVVAPQVVMFVGLTRATIGLDHVRPGGDRDPTAIQAGRRAFRWITWPMVAGFVLRILGLVVLLEVLLNG